MAASAIATTPVEDIEASPSAAPATPQVQEKRIERMKTYFENRPKEKIKIRKELGEQWSQINGYAFRMQAGVPIKVPTDVAELLRDGEII